MTQNDTFDEPAPATVLVPANPDKLPQLYAALAAAHGAFTPIIKNRVAKIRPRDAAKTPYSFKYADLASVIDATRPALSAHGLSVMQPINDEDGALYLYTIIAHADGAAIISKYRLNGPEPGLDLKVYGGELSFLRRYHYSGMLSLASEDDIDAGSDEPEVPERDRAPDDDIRTRKAPARRSAKLDDPALAGIGERNLDVQNLPSVTTRIGVGEKKWLETKLVALNLSDETQASLLKRHGASSWPELTMAQFTAIRAELLKV